jgi:glutamate N-acetyltransferase/amino-acid N-acetyltransferase
MPVGMKELPELHAIPGFRLGTTRAGIKKPDRRDLVVMALAEGAVCAAVFTRNAFCAAPVIVAREHLAVAPPRYLVINTGNANAGTGEQGLADARAVCRAVAEATGCAEEEVLPFSTGVIGEPLPVERIVNAVPAACGALGEDEWREAAHGILTTDTVPKGISRRVQLQGRTVTITGIAKGSGMIRPDMATMLAYVATDAALDRGTLQSCLEQAVAGSFNRITVDGDTSTNDACVLVATGASGVCPAADSGDYAVFAAAVEEVCRELAQAIVRDGEGATKFVTVRVGHARSEAEAEQVAYTIAHSPLVKTALYASDPNWGRILAAVGRAGVADLDLNAVTIHLDDVCIVRNGGRDPDYREEAGQAVMDREEITIGVDLGRGSAQVEVWTCDLSYEYVRINAEYRT